MILGQLVLLSEVHGSGIVHATGRVFHTKRSKMMNATQSRLLVLFIILGGPIPTCLTQSHPLQHGTSAASDTCPGPWHRAGFEGFKIGMRVPRCTLRSRVEFSARDEYRRKTSANEYAIRPSSRNDETESRLNPATVLAHVSVNMDHASAVTELFSDLAEIQDLCADSCRIVGLGRYRSDSRFALFPKNPTDEQRAWALRATSHMSPQDRPDNPVPVIYFYWEQKQLCTHFDNGSLGWPIVRAEFTVADISFPRERAVKPDRSSSCYESGFTDLGELNH